MGKAGKSLTARLRRFNADSLPSLLQYGGVERPPLDPWAARWQAHPVHAAYAAACQAVNVLQQLGAERVAGLVESEPELAQALGDTFFCCPAGAASLGAFLAGSGLADLAARYFSGRGDVAVVAPAASEAQGTNEKQDKEELLDAFLTCHWLLAGWALAITLLTADRSPWGPSALAAATATRQAILTATTSLWSLTCQPPLSSLLERQRPPAWAVAAAQSAVRACEQLLGASGTQDGVAFTRLAGQEVPWQLEAALCTLSSCLLGGWVLLGSGGGGGGSWAPAGGAAGEGGALTEDELNNLANAALEAADTVRRAGYYARTREWYKRWLPESHVHLVVLAVAAAYASLFVGSERPTQRTVAVDMLGWLPYEFLHTEMPNVLNTQRGLVPGGLPSSLACHTLAPIYTHLLHCIDVCRTGLSFRDPANAKMWTQAAAEERGRLDAEAATAAVAPAFGFPAGSAPPSTAGRGGGGGSSSSSGPRDLPAAGSSAAAASAAAGGQEGADDAPSPGPAASQPRPGSPSRLMPPGGPLLSAEDDATEALVLIASLMHAALTFEDCQQQLAAGRAGQELAAAGLPPPRPAGQHLCVTAVAAVQAILKEMLGSGRPLCTAHGPYVQRVVGLCLQAARAGGAALPGVTCAPPDEPLAVLAEEAADIVRSRRLLVDLVKQEQERMDREAKAAAHAAAQREKRAAKKKAQREAKRAQRAQQPGEADLDSEVPGSSATSVLQRQGEEQRQEQQQQAATPASSAVRRGVQGDAAAAGPSTEQQGQGMGPAEEDEEQRRQRAEEVAQQLIREEEERAEAAAARAAQRAAKKKAKRQQRRRDPSASGDGEGPSCSAAQQAERAAGQAAAASEPAAARPAAAEGSPASSSAPASEGDVDEWEAAAERLLASVSTSSAPPAAQPTPAAAADVRHTEADAEAEWGAAAAWFEAGRRNAGSSGVLSEPLASADQEGEWEAAATSSTAAGAAGRNTTSSSAPPAAAAALRPEAATPSVSGQAAGGGQQQQQPATLGQQPPWPGVGSRAPAAQQAASTAGMVLQQRRGGPERATPATPALAPQPAAPGAPGGPNRWSSLVTTGQAQQAVGAVRPPPGFAQPAAGGGVQMPPGFSQPAAAAAQWPSLGASGSGGSSSSSSSATSTAPQLRAAADAARSWAPLGGPPPAAQVPLSQPLQPPSSALPARAPHVHPSASAPAFVGQPMHGDAAGQKHCVVECVLCLEAPPDCVLLPCRHLALCTACAEGVWQARQPAAAKLCPVCRTEVAHLFQVFLP